MSVIPLVISMLCAGAWFVLTRFRKNDPPISGKLAWVGLGVTGVAVVCNVLAALVVVDPSWKAILVIGGNSVGLLALTFSAGRASTQVHKESIKSRSGWGVVALFLLSAGAFAWSAWLALAPYQS